MADAFAQDNSRNLNLGLAYGNQIAGGIGQIAGSYINYENLKTQEMFAQNRAAEIELQAKERTNVLLEQFNKAIGNAKYSAARRGVKASEGSVMRNIEQSGRDIGKDSAKMAQTARTQSRALRTQSSINMGIGASQSLNAAMSGMQTVNRAGSKLRELSELYD